jgi:enterochelin esterase-like enzyme
MTSTRLQFLLVFVAAASALVVPSAQPPAQQGPDYNAYYQIGPDSVAHDGVPKGEVRGPLVLPSQAYPGTKHTYWVYVPAQYDPAVPSSLMIFQDGQAFKDMDGVVRAPNVLDNLIYRREIPVMIVVFINPGRTPEQPEPTPSNWGDRDTNRPTEYNTLDDKYARVVVDELMPALYEEYAISKDPNRHGIGGASSGAIAAITVAWQRPNEFRKGLSIVGSFVNLRGGDAYADIVRQSEKKPIRIFLQDGRNDNRGVGRGGAYDQRRDWFYQNVRLMQALTDKGYDVNYTWGINTHGQRMGGPILPEMMRWLWRDHPVSTDVNDAIERSFNAPKKTSPATPPKEWIDDETGHRVVRLTDDAGGSTLYFHDNAFSPQGDAMMFNTPNGIAIVEVAKIGTDAARPEMVASGARGGYFARRTREIYYNSGGRGTTTALNIDTRKTRDVASAGGILNADETLSVIKNGNAVDPDGTHPRQAPRPVVPQLQRMFPGKTMEDLTPDQRYSVTKEDGLAARALNPTLQSFVFTSLKTGESHERGFQYGDLNHLQFNPVDPNLLLYCHEGTWHELDRTWTIRADGSQLRLMHHRTMDMEINGHEWWSWDGKTVWFDLQTPRSQDFWIAGVNMDTGTKTRYHLQRAWWGVHFNSSRDDTLFASDGGDASQVAYAADGMWINLLRVQPNESVTREKLVDMSRHNYVTGHGGVEPNVHITPDKKWVVFTGQFAPGQRHVYAVEIDKGHR